MITREQRKAMKWLDNVIKCQEFLNTHLDNDIAYCACYLKEIHIYKGAKKLATTLGIDYKVDYIDTSSEISHRISFPYRGYTVFQLVRRY